MKMESYRGDVSLLQNTTKSQIDSPIQCIRQHGKDPTLGAAASQHWFAVMGNVYKKCLEFENPQKVH